MAKVADPFYRTKQWYKVRQKALMRANYCCEECGVCQRKGLHVHHVKSRKEYPMMALELSNLIVLCTADHNRRHDRINDKAIEKIPVSDDGFSSDEWR